MNHSESIKELATALAKAQAEIKGAIKDSENPFYKSKYADLSAVWDACRGPLSANGLSVVQGGTVLDGNAYLETLLVHSSGEWLSAIQPMHPAKDDPQGWVACTTYMRRAGLAAIAGVSPEDDDGNEASGKPAVGTKAAAQYVAKDKISTMTASRPTFDEQHAALKTEMDAKKVADNPEVNPFSGEKYETRTISVPQGKRLYAIAKGAGWTDDELKKALMDGWKIEHSKDIKAGKQYEEICEFFKQGGKPPAQKDEPEDPFAVADAEGTPF